jgi:hypothetical protein
MQKTKAISLFGNCQTFGIAQLLDLLIPNVTVDIIRQPETGSNDLGEDAMRILESSDLFIYSSFCDI